MTRPPVTTSPSPLASGYQEPRTVEDVTESNVETIAKLEDAAKSNPALHTQGWALRNACVQASDSSNRSRVLRKPEQYGRSLPLFSQEGRYNSLQLRNCDLDTGEDTRAAEYSLTDEAYAKLVSRLVKRKFDLMTLALRDNILSVYSDLSTPIATKKDRSRWQALLVALDQLKSATPGQTFASNPVEP